MLRTLQRNRILEMLQPYNVPFKIIILDKNTQNILSSIIKLSDLRNSGVTAHFLITSERTEIKDISAIYFVSSPSELIKDISRDLYHSYYIHISTLFKRSFLEKLAQEVSEKRIASKIIEIKDQFIDFTALEEDLFVFNIENSYINKEEVEILRNIVIKLFSVFITLNEIPFIIGDKSHIGKMLYQKIANTKIIKSGLKKSLLIIIDRDFDLITPINHNMDYIGLINDIFTINHNKIKINNEISYDLDTDCEFYKRNRFLEFPVVAESVNEELREYKKEMALHNITDRSDKESIRNTLEKLPDLQKKNEMINIHLNISMKIVEIIKERKLDEFYRMEQLFETNEITELIESNNINKNDVERLAIKLLNTKNADLIGPILEKVGVSDEVVRFIEEKKKPEEKGLRSKMRNMIFKRSMPICEKVEEVLNSIKKQNYGELEYYDVESTGLFYSEISRIVVYVHGGVTYSELRELIELGKSYQLPILAGGCEMLNANGFLKQLKSKIKNQ